MPSCFGKRSSSHDSDDDEDEEDDEKGAYRRTPCRESNEKDSSDSKYRHDDTPAERHDRSGCFKRLIRAPLPVWLRVFFVTCDLAGIATLGYSLGQDYWKIKKTIFLNKGMKLNKHFDTPIGIAEGTANSVREAALALLAVLVASLALVMCCEALIICLPDVEHKATCSRSKCVPSLRQLLWSFLILFAFIWICIYEVIAFGGLVYWPEPLLKLDISVPVNIKPRLGVQLNAGVCTYVLASSIVRWWTRDPAGQFARSKDPEDYGDDHPPRYSFDEKDRKRRN